MKSLAELQAIRDRVKSSVALRVMGEVDYRVVVGMATCGIAAGAQAVMKAASEEVLSKGINAMVTMTGCNGSCDLEPVVDVIAKDGTKTTYVKMTAEKMIRVIDEHVANGNVVEEYTKA